MSEEEFERAVVELARMFGWRAMGSRPARTKQGWRTPWKYDGKGWPDLALVHPERGLIVLAEIKTSKGRLAPEQEAWGETLTALASVALSVEYAVWRPADAAEIGELLSGGRVLDWRL